MTDPLVALRALIVEWDREAARREADPNATAASLLAAGVNRSHAQSLRAALDSIEEVSRADDRIDEIAAAWGEAINRGSVLTAMASWPEGSNGPIAISAYESLVRRLIEFDATLSAARMRLAAASPSRTG